ncbi:MAG: hypothetical protein WC256_11455 [Desulfurivibrionaceae bacterium]|jgi:hypothetical protein
MKISISTEVLSDSPAYSLFEDFLQAADAFSVMQQEHQAALISGNCKDVFSWRQGREQAFRSLVRMLEQVVACGKDNKEYAVCAQEIMGQLLAGEDALQELIIARQLKVQEQLLAMRKGKEALQGYNINKGLVPRPRYLSNRM